MMYMRNKIKKDKILVILLAIAIVLILLSKFLDYYKIILASNISFLFGFLFILIMGIMTANKIYKSIKCFYNRIWDGKNIFIKYLCKKKQFQVIVFLFVLNELLRLGLLIIGIFAIVSYYRISIVLLQSFKTDWFSAITLFIILSFSFYLTILIIIASIKFELKNSNILVYLDEQLKASKNVEDFDNFLFEYSNRLVKLSNNYKEHVETYYSLRFTECYIKNFFYLPTLEMKIKKDLVIEHISKALNGTYVNIITAVKEIDNIIKSKCEEDYETIKNYLMKIHDIKEDELFSILEGICLTKFDKIKKFILAHDEILVFLFKLICFGIILTLAIRFPDVSNRIIEMTNIIH